jgi:hypothetical protein
LDFAANTIRDKSMSPPLPTGADVEVGVDGLSWAQPKRKRAQKFDEFMADMQIKMFGANSGGSCCPQNGRRATYLLIENDKSCPYVLPFECPAATACRSQQKVTGLRQFHETFQDELRVIGPTQGIQRHLEYRQQFQERDPLIRSSPTRSKSLQINFHPRNQVNSVTNNYSGNTPVFLKKK